ncbi:hypothetical protein B2G71_10650 [Novosphingobium sp. PC22D]|uniref:tetratricopeptide repeat protein n=1 Tax=Novosphingobium sp. PC22D TaxID=1962403 RepID=UPI000BF1CDAA|nr:tetratricopeptide repeat protein [Novosphingobium sp. PC22D]PEQ12749.1 hypothetical protein B2G71_10650 [Novosphingobium sp. PC22D]
MSANALVAAVLIGQAAFSMAIEPQTGRTDDVAFSELADGQAAAAIAKLEESRRVDRDDPATLINLGTAYARMGMTEKALRAYTDAIDSDERYELELANGEWMDSRDAALRARDRLLQAKVIASRR